MVSSVDVCCDLAQHSWLTTFRQPDGGERSNVGGQDSWKEEQALNFRRHRLEWEGRARSVIGLTRRIFMRLDSLGSVNSLSLSPGRRHLGLD